MELLMNYIRIKFINELVYIQIIYDIANVMLELFILNLAENISYHRMNEFITITIHQ